ncbi:epithelial-stromal interaction protein 1 isoform X2 [Siniperca chuatsi]|uniref:epithelial-stromal interaction protein 1 isoform X2 n=1 Tax=Siniperca chuatsi TaxID=119488 RepID=UPI001CE1B9E9|nr:epithelial-stromal interaction protein 1 isoform X2 [Siniperca chuatsi]
MDPYQNQRNSRNHLAPLNDSNTSGVSGNDHTPYTPDRDATDSGHPQAAARQPQHSGGFTMIPPNESRRSKIKLMAQKEEEDLQKWKEANRAPPLQLNPEKLGGHVTLAGAREKQLTDLRCSKLQKKLRKEELDKRRRQEEEEELQKMKAIQREKAEHLEERRKQEEQRRREQLRQDHSRTTESFLQRFERRAPGPLATSSATHTSSRSEVVETKQREESKSVREVQLEHKRVNSAFLDKLEGHESERETKGESVREAEYPFLASEDFRHQPSSTPGQQLPLAHMNLDPEQSCSDWTQEADPEPDYDWALMKLMNSFPDCCRVFLEDILDQCDGDYEQAYTLLISTLS